jgi:hypothetical protein
MFVRPLLAASLTGFLKDRFPLASQPQILGSEIHSTSA